MYGKRSRAKHVGVCGQCGRDVWGPPYARILGTVKACKYCRQSSASYIDPEAEAERRYFEKFDAGYQMDVQGFVSSP